MLFLGDGGAKGGVWDGCGGGGGGGRRGEGGGGGGIVLYLPRYLHDLSTVPR